MTTKNDITGDKLVTKTPTDAYREGYDRIFSKKPDPHDRGGKLVNERLENNLPPHATWFKLNSDPK